jgi:ketosteroid isomerase-like protein
MATSVLLASSGCSLGGDDEPKPASGPTAQIAATVDRLERAVATRDFQTICDQLFTAQARRRSGGAECARQLGSATKGVKKPSIEIEAIDVQGNRAIVKVRTRAQGQARVSDELQMRREGGRWLVEALG